MVKNYLQWTPVKILLNKNTQRPTYKEGDVFWMSVGENIGFEQDGKGRLSSRPVLIIRGFSRELFWGIPLTSQPKRGKYYYGFTMNGRVSTAILSQMRAFDAKRIVDASRMGRVDNGVMDEIKNRLKVIL